MTKNQKSWSERFNETWVYAGLDYPKRDKDAFDYLKSFIHQELLEVLESLRMEKKQFEFHSARFTAGYHEACRDLDKKLDQLKKEVGK